MIEWLSVGVNNPKAGREIIALNPKKVIMDGSAAKCSRVIKFHPDFTEKQIEDNLLDEGFTLWAYVI